MDCGNGSSPSLQRRVFLIPARGQIRTMRSGLMTASKLFDPKHAEVRDGEACPLGYLCGASCGRGPGSEVFHLGREGGGRFHLGVFQYRG